MGNLKDLYQEVIIDHNRCPRNCHKMNDFDRNAEGFNPLCGDKINLYIKLNNGFIKDVSFVGSGCAISTASASLMTEKLKGMSIEEARDLFTNVKATLLGENDEELDIGKLDVLKGVREFPARVKCATLAWHTFMAALNNDSDIASTEG